jgi:glutaconate CoA-transferase, subunit A
VAVVLPLDEAISELVKDGDVLALEGFSHLIPYAAGHEILRQGQTDLTLVRMVPDIIGDQFIGLGRLSRLVFSWGGNPGVGSLHRFRDAVEHGWPRPLNLEEHTHAGLANRFVAGAANLPFAVLRGYSGTDLPAHTNHVRGIECPFTGERLMAVAAVRPDVAIIHAQRADRAGNVQLWGITGVQKEAALSARSALVTVEEVVDDLSPMPNSVVLPTWAITYVAATPGGSWPSYAQGYSTRDDAFYRTWDQISRDRERFLQWMDVHVLRGAGSTSSARDTV